MMIQETSWFLSAINFPTMEEDTILRWELERDSSRVELLSDGSHEMIWHHQKLHHEISDFMINSNTNVAQIIRKNQIYFAPSYCIYFYLIIITLIFVVYGFSFHDNLLTKR